MDDTNRKQFTLITYAQLLVLVGILVASVVWAQKFFVGSRIPDLSRARPTVEVSVETASVTPADSSTTTTAAPSSDHENEGKSDNLIASTDLQRAPTNGNEPVNHSVSDTSDITEVELDQSDTTLASEPAGDRASVTEPSGLDDAREQTAGWLSAFNRARSELSRSLDRAEINLAEATTNASAPETAEQAADSSSHTPSSSQEPNVVRITNATDYPVSFMWKDVSRQLKPRQSVDLELVSAESNVRYDRGGSFGEVTVPIQAGKYEFEVSRKGWRLTEVTINSDNN